MVKARVKVRSEEGFLDVGDITGDREVDFRFELAWDDLTAFMYTLYDILKEHRYKDLVIHDDVDSIWVGFVFGNRNFEQEEKEIIKAMREDYRKLKRQVRKYFKELNPIYLRLRDISDEFYPWRFIIRLVDSPRRLINADFGVLGDYFDNESFFYEMKPYIDIYEFEGDVPLDTMLKITKVAYPETYTTKEYEVECNHECKVL